MGPNPSRHTAPWLWFTPERSASRTAAAQGQVGGLISDELTTLERYQQQVQIVICDPGARGRA